MSDLLLKLILSSDNKKLVSGVKQSESSVMSLDKSVNQASGSTRQFEADSAAAGTNASNSFATVAKAAAGMYAALKVGQQAVQFTDTIAQYQDMSIRLENLSGSAAAYADNEQFLIELADDHHKNLLVLANSYSRIQALEKGGLVTRAQSRDLLEGLSNAGSALGASNVQLEQSLYGVAQGFSSGILRAEELNQVTEPLPGLMQELDEAAEVTAGGFRKMVNEGEVTSVMFRETLLEALEEYDGAAAATANNLTAKYADIANSRILLARTFEEPISDALAPVLEISADALSLMAENGEVVITVMEGMAVVIAGRVTASVLTATKAFAANVIVAKAEAQAYLQAARMAERKTAADLAAARAALARAQRARSGMLNQAAASNQLAAAQARVNVLEVAHARHLQTVTRLSRSASVASRALSGSMALLGGPLGVVLIAAGALATFASNSESADQKASELKGTVDELTDSYKDLSAIQLKDRLLDLDDTIADLHRLKDEADSLELKPIAITVSESARKNHHDFLVRAAADQERATENLAAAEQLRVDILERIRELETAVANTPTKTPSAIAKSDDVKAIEEELRSQEEKILESYYRRESMLALHLAKDRDFREEYYELSAALQKKRDAELSELRQRAAAEAVAARRENELLIAEGYNSQEQRDEAKHQERLAEIERTIATNALKAMRDNQILLALGYNSEEERNEAEHQQRLADIKSRAANDAIFDRRENELLQAQGYNSAEEKAEADHQQRLRDIENQFKQDVLGEFAVPDTIDEEIARLNELYDQKLQVVREREGQNSDLEVELTRQKNQKIAQLEQQAHQVRLGYASEFFGGIAEVAAVAAGKQSRIYRVAAISQAIIDTYKAANAAYAAMAGIPVIGPGLGAAAAGAAIAGGLANVAAIRSQDVSGIAHGGLTNVPEESTYLLDKNERVLSPRQNQDFTQFIQGEKRREAANEPIIVPPANVNLHPTVIVDRTEFRDYLSSDEGEQIILDTVRRNS